MDLGRGQDPFPSHGTVRKGPPPHPFQSPGHAGTMYRMGRFGAAIRSSTVLVGAALVAGSLALYLSTLAPTLTWGWDGLGVDGGEFLAAARTWGIPHPPGYPTYTLLLGSFASIVRIGDFAFRGNLLSSVLASTSVGLLYGVNLRCCRFLRPAAPPLLAAGASALGAAVLATSPLFWSQATITEVYALNLAFSAGLLLLAAQIALRRTAEPPPHVGRRMALFGLLLGLGLGNHLTLLAVALPALVWIGSAIGWRRVVSPWAAAGLILGLAVYVYLPIRASQTPPINWGDPDSLSGFGWMLSGRAYQGYLFGVPPEAILKSASSWLTILFSQFNPLGLFFGLMAVGPLRSHAPWLLGTGLLSIVAIIAYAVTFNSVDSQVLLIPAFLVFSTWVAAGFFMFLTVWLPRGLDSLSISRPVRERIAALHPALILSVAAFALLPGIGVALNYGSQNLRDDHRAVDRAAGIRDTAPDGSVVLGHSETDIFGLWYISYVESRERDVAIVAVPLLQFDWYGRDLHRRFPERMPADLPADIDDALRAIVRHNDGRSPTFFTFQHPLLLTEFGFRRAGNIYEALYDPDP